VLASDYNSPTYSSHLDYRCEAPFHACLLKCSFTNFLPLLTLNYNPSDFHLLSSWYYRCEPLHLAFCFHFAM
jgi:hypothetical protein